MDEKELWLQIEEIAARGRPDRPLSNEVLIQRLNELAKHNPSEPPLSADEVMRRVREIARSGRSVVHDEMPKP
jgi:hypothetical protein